MTAPCSRLARLLPRRRPGLVPFPPPLLLLLLLAAAGPARGWESGDLELFDLVEEVQLNFYQFLGVQQVSGAARSLEGCISWAERVGWGGKEGVGRALTGFSPREPGLRGKTWSSWARLPFSVRLTTVF